MSLLEAIKSASPERILEAFKAAIHAAHTNNPSHGQAAALAALVPVVEVLPVETEAAVVTAPMELGAVAVPGIEPGSSRKP